MLDTVGRGRTGGTARRLGNCAVPLRHCRFEWRRIGLDADRRGDRHAGWYCARLCDLCRAVAYPHALVFCSDQCTGLVTGSRDVLAGGTIPDSGGCSDQHGLTALGYLGCAFGAVLALDAAAQPDWLCRSTGRHTSGVLPCDAGRHQRGNEMGWKIAPGGQFGKGALTNYILQINQCSTYGV